MVQTGHKVGRPEEDTAGSVPDSPFPLCPLLSSPPVTAGSPLFPLFIPAHASQQGVGRGGEEAARRASDWGEEEAREFADRVFW